MASRQLALRGRHTSLRHRARANSLRRFDFSSMSGKADRSAMSIMMRTPMLLAICAIAVLPMSPSLAQQATELQVTYSKGQFQPAELRAPADKAITIRVKNLDAKAIEFESKTLRVEKVVAANSEALLNVRAQKPGRYEFFDDFNEKARGALVVQ